MSRPIPQASPLHFEDDTRSQRRHSWSSITPSESASQRRKLLPEQRRNGTSRNHSPMVDAGSSTAKPHLAGNGTRQNFNIVRMLPTGVHKIRRAVFSRVISLLDKDLHGRGHTHSWKITVKQALEAEMHYLEIELERRRRYKEQRAQSIVLRSPQLHALSHGRRKSYDDGPKRGVSSKSPRGQASASSTSSGRSYSAGRMERSDGNGSITRPYYRSTNRKRVGESSRSSPHRLASPGRPRIKRAEPNTHRKDRIDKRPQSRHVSEYDNNIARSDSLPRRVQRRSVSPNTSEKRVSRSPRRRGRARTSPELSSSASANELSGSNSSKGLRRYIRDLVRLEVQRETQSICSTISTHTSRITDMPPDEDGDADLRPFNELIHRSLEPRLSDSASVLNRTPPYIANLPPGSPRLSSTVNMPSERIHVARPLLYTASGGSRVSRRLPRSRSVAISGVANHTYISNQPTSNSNASQEGQRSLSNLPEPISQHHNVESMHSRTISADSLTAITAPSGQSSRTLSNSGTSTGRATLGPNATPDRRSRPESRSNAAANRDSPRLVDIGGLDTGFTTRPVLSLQGATPTSQGFVIHRDEVNDRAARSAAQESIPDTHVDARTPWERDGFVGLRNGPG